MEAEGEKDRGKEGDGGDLYTTYALMFRSEGLPHLNCEFGKLV